MRIATVLLLFFAVSGLARADQYPPSGEILWAKMTTIGSGCPSGASSFDYVHTWAGLGVLQMELDQMEIGPEGAGLDCTFTFPFKVPAGKRLSMRAVWVLGKTRFDYAGSKSEWIIDAGREGFQARVGSVSRPGNQLPLRKRESLQLKDAALSTCGDDAKLVTRVTLSGSNALAKVDRLKWILAIEDCEQ